jgi:NAD(P)-dependent dehydrogenase (short-subunit alcohol dehydrogenase family)
MSRTFVIPAISLALLSVALYHVVRHSQAEPPLAPPVAPARVPFSDSIAGSGVVEPWTENVALGTHVAGVVQDVCVVVGQQVKRGEPLLRIDERQLRADVSVREAMLASAQAQLEKLEQQPRPEELPGSAAKVREAVLDAGDCSEDDTARALVARAVDTWGRLDALVNNAGILRDRTVAKMSVEEWDAVVKVHLRGHFLPTHHACAYWKDAGTGGRIVCTASSSGLLGNFGQANYGAAKAGIAAFTSRQRLQGVIECLFLPIIQRNWMLSTLSF